MIATNYLKGVSLVLLSALMFGSYGIWSKLLGPEWGIFFQGWVRSLIVLLILLPIAYFTGSWKRIERADYKWILTAVFFGAATQAPLYYAFTHAGIGISSVIFFSVFLLTSYLIGWFLIGERMTTVKVISFIIAFVGLFLTFGLSVRVFSVLALFAAGINGIASGGEVSITKKVTKWYSSLQITVYVWLGILITHVPLSFFFHEKQLTPSLTIPWFSMLMYAIAGIIGFWAVVEGFKYLDASIGGLIGLLEIVFSILFGILFFHELITAPIILGALLILLAATLPYSVSQKI